ncbi:MAG: hypothetical protein WBG08_11040, partial [Litorimonas sp.]
PVLSTTQLGGQGGSARAPRLGAETVDAYVPALPLPEFLDLVFGEMLDVPYVTGPDVAERDEVIQIRSSGTMSARNFLSLVSGALQEYGIRVVPQDGAYAVLNDATLRSRIPEFIKSRARLRTRADLRPVVQFVELRAIDPNSMQSILQEAFGRNPDNISIKAQQGDGYISLAGLPADVDAAIAIIQQLDDLEFAGSQVVRYTPRYWDVTELSQDLATALRFEGWEVSTNVAQTRTIALLPVAFSNDLFVFAKTELAQERVADWIREFDSPAERGDAEQVFIYQVQNVDATLLAETANRALGQGGLEALIGEEPGGVGIVPGESVINQRDTRGGLSGRTSGGPFTVDRLGNRLLYTGTGIEYEKVVEFLETLDTPAPEVLIEVQIAEVTLTDGLNYGVELFSGDLLGGSDTLTAGTGGLELGGSGVTVSLLSGDATATLNTLASNRQVKVLSTPVLVARSGSVAEIQVGQDVPVISSQRAAPSQDGTGSLDVLQQVNYRSTGVLLSIEPIVFSNRRVDLTVSQEVSSTIEVPNAPISSPTISNRSLSTQLSLEDGQTAVLGGLIQENTVRDQDGVPILKDIPIVGGLFSNNSFSQDRTELVVLITAYVLRGQVDKSQFVQEMSGRIDRAFSDRSRMMTLEPSKL